MKLTRKIAAAIMSLCLVSSISVTSFAENGANVFVETCTINEGISTCDGTPPSSSSVWNLEDGAYTGNFEVNTRVYTNYFFSNHDGEIFVNLNTYQLGNTGVDVDDSEVSLEVSVCKDGLFGIGVDVIETEVKQLGDSLSVFSNLSPNTKYYICIEKDAVDAVVVAGSIKVYTV